MDERKRRRKRAPVCRLTGRGIWLAMALVFAARAGAGPATLALDDFESPTLRGWAAQPRSRVGQAAGPLARLGAGALKWTFSSNGTTRYNNSITKAVPKPDLTPYDQIALWFKSLDPLQGRVGFEPAIVRLFAD